MRAFTIGLFIFVATMPDFKPRDKWIDAFCLAYAAYLFVREQQK